MFVALRDLLNAKGRFGLIAGVVALVTFLVVMLTGLTAGLGKQNTSALEALDPAAVTFDDPDNPSYTTSRIAEADEGTTPLGTGQTLMTRADGSEDSVAILGLPSGTTLPDSQVLEDHAIASKALKLIDGESITVGGAPVTVGTQAEDLYFAHSPVLWVPTETWQAAMHTDAVGTVELSDDKETAPEGSVALKDSFDALPAYSSEQGSLKMIQGFLYLISALVTVAFLSVWTAQRTRDLSILKAIGASNSYLLKDSIGQAALILALGAVIGTAAAAGLGALAANVAPFVLSPASVILPALAIWILGMGGAALATRSISRVDPQLALGGAA
ncbi:ABC transporter permease [Corynebacterium sp. P3-F1]|uniref:ABC transporter permease n=1 Tax=Corynebacterium sp. P3-F1 TaxID=3059080 RepID=UPI00265CAC40|nr:ABC transporter permease [Corynebacterium sp. P3-F1]WKK60567.1 ABC transporter permease [Corynebacterium sp. P3-F1]